MDGVIPTQEVAVSGYSVPSAGVERLPVEQELVDTRELKTDTDENASDHDSHNVRLFTGSPKPQLVISTPRSGLSVL